jgi:MerR family transcriptional regulator/heat shock protein HspR
MGGDEGKYVMSVAVGMTGIEAHRIRRYESAGLLCPCRTGGGQRLFSDDDIVVIREIAGLEEQGVNLSGVKLILDMRKTESGRPTKDN